tara:strand:- start:6830 stop:8122 length:1293 start_codon:yes stop_codon:yes gene_type:complete
MTKARHTANLVDANGDIQSAHLDNVPASNDASALNTGTLPDARLSNQVKVVKSGSAPSNPQEGDLWYDTSNEILKVYNSTDSAFVKVVRITPVLSSVTGGIVNGTAGNLTLNGEGFLNANLVVSFTPSGGSASTVTVTPTTDVLATVAVPSAIYGQSTGTVIGIKVTNSDSKSSATVNKTVTQLPTGGTISNISGYRVHTFNSSANFVTYDTRTLEYLMVAGGGGGGWDVGGGGGAGGMLTGSVSKTANTYSIVIGAGGAGASGNSTQNNGTNSTAFGLTAIGGGGGGNWNNSLNSTKNGADGGSGGGGGGWSQSSTGGNGTVGQGNDGGDAPTNQAGKSGGGGGGAGGAGQDEQGTNSQDTALAGIGLASSITGSSVTYAIGGTGGNDYAYASQAVGEVNKGGGGDGDGSSGSGGLSGGSGVVIIRYAV